MIRKKMTTWGRMAFLALGIVSFSAVGAFLLMPQAYAGNGGGHGGGNGGGHGGGNGGHGGGQGGAHGNAGGGASGTHGQGTGGAQSTKAKGPASGSNVSRKGSVSPSALGKLNGFMHASPSALAHAAPTSAIGKVAVAYRDVLAGYVSGQATLADVAAALAAASNKPLSAEIVGAINERVAQTNPENTALGGLANPTADPAVAAQNEALAGAIADMANEMQSGSTTSAEGDGDATDSDATDGETDGDASGDTGDDQEGQDSASSL